MSHRPGTQQRAAASDLVRGVLALLLCVCGASAAAASPDAPRQCARQVWFAPPFRQERVYGPQAQTNPFDTMKLFEADAPWSQARQHINVFKIYHWQILSNLGNPTAEADLRRMFAYLDAHYIALALEFGPLTIIPGGGGGKRADGINPTEAYQFSERAADLAHAIKRLGGTLAYIAMDEPFVFGLRQWNPSGCQTSPRELAANAARSLRVFRDVFPGVQVGDIENIIGPEMLETIDGASPGRWLREYREFVRAMRAQGFPLLFFHGDVCWQTSWAVTAAKLRTMLGHEVVAFGLIFNASDYATSDALWMTSAERQVDDYRSSGVLADQVVFQSWNPFPNLLLPETAPCAFTHLVNYFFDTKPQSPAKLARFYRLYNPVAKRHFYTTGVGEIESAKRAGFRVEEIIGYLYTSEQAVNGLVPLRRLCNTNGGDYLYVISDLEVNAAELKGYRDDGIQGYVFAPRSSLGWPVYGANLGTERLLTVDPAEYEIFRNTCGLGELFEILPF